MQSSNARQVIPMVEPGQRMSDADRAAIQLKFIGQGAIQFDLEFTVRGIPTLGIQQTSVVSKSGRREGKWDAKVKVQLMPDTELIQFIHALNGRMPLVQSERGLQFKHHGPQRDKMLTLKPNSDGSFYFGCMQGKEVRHSTVVPPSAVNQILTLAYKAYAARFQINVIDAITLLRTGPVSEMPR